MIKMQFTIPDMACSACVESITKAIKDIDSTASVNADLTTKAVNIDTKASDSSLREAIAAAGYTIA